MNGPETSPETTLDALSFEQALSELEAIVEKLEGGAADELIALARFAIDRNH